MLVHSLFQNVVWKTFRLALIGKIFKQNSILAMQRRQRLLQCATSQTLFQPLCVASLSLHSWIRQANNAHIGWAFAIMHLHTPMCDPVKVFLNCVRPCVRTLFVQRACIARDNKRNKRGPKACLISHPLLLVLNVNLNNLPLPVSVSGPSISQLSHRQLS